MTTAALVCAEAGLENLVEVGGVEVADWLLDEVAAAHGAIAGDGDDGFASPAGFAVGGVVVGVVVEKGVDGVE